MSNDQGLDAIDTSRGREVSYRGENVEVRPITIGRIPAFSRAARPLFDELAGGKAVEDIKDLQAAQVFDWLDRHGDRLVEAVAIAVKREAAWIADGNPDEFVELALVVISVNLDFFGRHLLPRLASVPRELVTQLGASGTGPTPSKPS